MPYKNKEDKNRSNRASFLRRKARLLSDPIKLEEYREKLRAYDKARYRRKCEELGKKPREFKKKYGEDWVDSDLIDNL